MTVKFLLSTIINIVLGIVTFFLGARIILRLFGANPLTPFVAWIYSVSEVILSPFKGIFPSTSITGSSVFDISAFIALVVYAVVSYVVLSLLNMLFESIYHRRVHGEEIHGHSHI